jgi:hypothetical protein
MANQMMEDTNHQFKTRQQLEVCFEELTDEQDQDSKNRTNERE